MRRRDCAGASLQRDPYALNLRRSHDISPLFTKTSWNSGGMNYHGPREHIQQERLLEKSLRPGQIGWSPYYLHENSCREKALLQARHIDRNYVSHPADQLSAPNEVPNCDMAKIEISVGGCGRSSLDCDTGRCPSRAFVRRRTDGEPESGCAPASAEQFCLSPTGFRVGLRDCCKYLSHECGRPRQLLDAHNEYLSFLIAKKRRAGNQSDIAPRP